ncbi:hypothetical protein H0H92_005959 [Tricholoma furcatifolium]|nr:hypothetical protein H0H92_005959 [Tricholoma furcatifolium]
MEQKLRTIFIIALVALAMQSRQYPRRLMLQDVTYQLEELNHSTDGDIDGFLNGKEVKIVFEGIDSDTKKYWITRMVLAAQVPVHENVLQILGLVSSPDPLKYFPGIAFQGHPDKGLERLDIFLNSDQAANLNTHTRRSLIMDIAAGISHIYKNGMEVKWNHVWFSEVQVPPHAFLRSWPQHLKMALKPTSSGFWLNPHDMDKFIEINTGIGLSVVTQSQIQQ